MTNQELIDLYSSLVEIENLPAGPVFTHAIVSNLALIRPLIEQVDAGYAPTEAYKAYEQDRDGVCRQFARKDVTGKPITVNDSYVIADHKGFREAIEKLREKYREAIDDYESEAARLIQFLAKEGPELPLHRVALADCPALTPVQMRGILPMIEAPETTPSG